MTQQERSVLAAVNQTVSGDEGHHRAEFLTRGLDRMTGGLGTHRTEHRIAERALFKERLRINAGLNIR